jgi:glutamyl/glutaminyl-tRNA synthetase
MPHILNPTGNKKLSKRDGAKDILNYKKEGYLKDAMINFLASLGWNDGTEQEVYSVPEIIDKFSLDKVQNSNAHFDERRLLWLNGAHIRELDIDTLYEKVASYWPKNIPEKLDNDDYKKRVLTLVQERLKFFEELPELTDFFFFDLPLNPELISGHKQLAKLPSQELSRLLQTSLSRLESSDFETSNLQASLNELLATTEQKPVVLFSLIRIATTQSPASPGLAETMSLLGKDKCLKRINEQLNAIG